LTAAAIAIAIKILFTIGFAAVALFILFFTKDGRVMLKWIAGIGAALGIGALIFVLIGLAVVWVLYEILMMFL